MLYVATRFTAKLITDIQGIYITHSFRINVKIFKIFFKNNR